MDANLFVKVTVISAFRHQVYQCCCCTIRSETCASVSQDSCVWYLHFGESSFSFFGHFSHRSEWQLIKIDYKGLFSRRCMDGDYQTWQLHNKVTAILNIIDLLWTPGDVCLSVVTVNKIHLPYTWTWHPPPPQLCGKTWLISSFFDRESCVWWVRNRSLWSAGQATVACWSRAIPGSFPLSHAFAQLTILNGNNFPVSTSPLCKLFLILSDLQLHVYKTAPSDSIVLH